MCDVSTELVLVLSSVIFYIFGHFQTTSDKDTIGSISQRAQESEWLEQIPEKTELLDPLPGDEQKEEKSLRIFKSRTLKSFSELKKKNPVNILQRRQ